MLKNILRFILKSIRKCWLGLGPNDFVRSISAGIIVMIIGISGIGLLLWSLSSNLPDLERLKDYEPRLTTRILDRNGETLLELYSQRRILVPLDSVPQHTIDAILTIENFGPPARPAG